MSTLEKTYKTVISSYITGPGFRIPNTNPEYVYGVRKSEVVDILKGNSTTQAQINRLAEQMGLFIAVRISKELLQIEVTLTI